MLVANLAQRTEVKYQPNIFLTQALEKAVQPDPELRSLLAELSADTPWGVRQMAAKRLGCMRSSYALPGLIAALASDPFWMVRCAVIQALEMIGDPAAVPALREAAQCDSFQAVRSYAAKAIRRFSL